MTWVMSSFTDAKLVINNRAAAHADALLDVFRPSDQKHS